MIEPEVAFYNLDQNMDLAEDFIKYVLHYVLDQCQDDSAYLDQRLANEEKTKPQIERRPMGLLEQMHLLSTTNLFVCPIQMRSIFCETLSPIKRKIQISNWSVGVDLQSEHERYLVEKPLIALWFVWLSCK